jgi:cardiolipin synthase
VSAVSKGGNWKVLSVLIALVAGVSDFFDGYLARLFHSESKIGELLDPFADKVFCNFAVCGLCFCRATPCPVFLVLMAALLIAKDLFLILGAIYAYFTKVKMEMKPVYISKICTFLIFVFFALSLMLGTENRLVASLGWGCILLIISSIAVYTIRFFRRKGISGMCVFLIFAH